eukprot:4763958-Prymnesium_polylepis.3
MWEAVQVVSTCRELDIAHDQVPRPGDGALLLVQVEEADQDGIFRVRLLSGGERAPRKREGRLRCVLGRGS